MTYKKPVGNLVLIWQRKQACGEGKGHGLLTLIVCYRCEARGFAIRDAFPDAMKGMITTEEANDTPRDDKQPHKKGEDTPEINTVIDSVAKEVEPTQDNPKTSNDGEQLTEGEVVVSPTEPSG